MKFRNARCWISLVLFVATAAFADEVSTQVDIPYDVFRLDNGLTVIVHSDHSIPTVFVGMWYGVGSKDEPPGKTGFAHLFEHLMFQGTENREGEYFTPFADAGATGMNGTTAEDRTNYFATVPTGALDMALWMESDRMTHLLGAIDQDALDEQRGVVQNEKRQREVQPYAQMWEKIKSGLYPPDHPYHHTVIGSMDDLNAASLEDVHEWFRTYYGGSNAVLVLAGDISTDDAEALVGKYFAAAPAGEPLSHPRQWVPYLPENREEIMYDNVGQTRIVRTWALPPGDDIDTTLMYLVNQTLVANKNAPLQKLLVDDLQLATSVAGATASRVMNSEYRLFIDLKPGVEPSQVLPLVDKVIAEYIAGGPDAQLLDNAKLAANMMVMGGLESTAAIGSVLAEGYLYADDPLHINKELRWLNDASPGQVQAAAARWLERGYYQLTVLPFPDYRVSAEDVDRSSIPPVTVVSDIHFPEIRSETLPNGIKLVVAERGSIPIVDVAIRVGAGETASPQDAHALADFVFALSDKGTKRFDANELAAARDRIAMGGGLSANLEDSVFNYRILNTHLEESLELAEEILRRPTYPDDEIEKFKQQLGGLLLTRQRNPASAAGSLFERVVYGEQSPVDLVWRPESLAQIDRDKLLRFHETQVVPGNTTIYMIGNLEFETAKDAVQKVMGDWRSREKPATVSIGTAAPQRSRVILVDHPGAESSTIYAGHAIAPWSAETSTEQSILNYVFGGSFESRLNMNLREDKAWSYGYRSSIRSNTSGDQLLQMAGQVQTDKTAPAMQEIRREFQEFAGTHPPTEEEVSRARYNRIRSLPGTFDTNRGFLASIMSADAHGLPFDYAEGRAERIREVSAEGVADSARSMFRPEQLAWVVIGDLSKIEESVRELDYGEVEVWDAFGNEVR